MMKLLGILMKRPTDANIKKGKIIFGIFVILVGILVFGVQKLEIQSPLFGMELTANLKIILQYSILVLGCFPLVLGGLDLHILSRGRTRILQIIFGIILLFISGFFQETATLGANIGYFFLGLIALFAGISGKAITQKGLKHGQKITKIRV